MIKLKEWGMFGLLGLIWGSSFLWIKVAMGNGGQPFLGVQIPADAIAFGPMLLVAFRLLFGMLGMAFVLLLRRPAFPRDPKVYLGFVVMGVFYGALPFALITWGETRIDSTMAAILNGTVPLFTMVIAHFWLGDEKLSLARVIGLFIGFCGLAVLVGRNLQDARGDWLGQAAVVAAAISYAVASTFSRRHLRNQSPMIQSFFTLLVADLCLVPAVGVFEAPIRLPVLPIAWFAVAWLGLLGSCLAYLLYFSLINAWGPTRATLVTYIFPLIGLLLGILLLGERADARLFIGAGLIFSGIAAANPALIARLRRSK